MNGRYFNVVLMLSCMLGSGMIWSSQLSEYEAKQLQSDRARSRDKKTFSIFTQQLDIFNNPGATARTRSGAAMNLVRLYEEFADEMGRSAALTQLNKHGLTLDALKKIASAARHTVKSFRKLS